MALCTGQWALDSPWPRKSADRPIANRPIATIEVATCAAPVIGGASGPIALPATAPIVVLAH